MWTFGEHSVLGAGKTEREKKYQHYVKKHTHLKTSPHTQIFFLYLWPQYAVV